MENNNLITTKELMSKLQLSEPSIIRYRKKGTIPYFRIGNVIRYDYDRVLQALEKKGKAYA